MFEMVNRYGNVFKNVKSVREKEGLEKQGYRQVEPKHLKIKSMNGKSSNKRIKTPIQNNEKGKNS